MTRTGKQVSIIIPAYNRADFVGLAIRSALNQIELDLEVIVVDDGSTDGTGEVVRGIQDPRLKYIYQANQGKGGAINRGAAESKGEYIGKLDSDDWYLEDSIKGLARRLDETPKLGVAAGGYHIVDQAGKQIQDVSPWITRPNLDVATWIQGCPVLWQGALVRRSWFEKVGGVDPRISGPDDWDFGIRLALAGCPMTWVKSTIFNYRVHAGMSNRQVSRYNQEAVQILDHYFEVENRRGEILSVRQEAYRKTYINCAGRAYGAALFDEAKDYFSKAIQVDPSMLAEDGKNLFFTIAWWAQSPVITNDPVGFVDAAAANLPVEAGKIRFARQKAQAELRAVRLFQAYEDKDWAAIRRQASLMLKNSPWQFLDRGILATTLRASLND